MPGAYCRYCDTRCFVYREVYAGGVLVWSGHLATCPAGKAHDRTSIGQDADTAHNPAARPEGRPAEAMRPVLRAIQARDPDGGQVEPTGADYAAHEAWAIEAYGPDAWAAYRAGGWDDDPADEPRHVEW